MSYTIVGEQIMKYRKEKGMTQRELGEAIGVSGSAVSQWESGGTPDISLLPALSDILGVTVDALFGRTETRREDLGETVGRYIQSFPKDRQLKEMTALMRVMLTAGSVSEYADSFNINMDAHDAETTYIARSGVATAVTIGKTTFVSAVCDPEGGLNGLLSCNENMCRLFSALSDPQALMLLTGLSKLVFEPHKYRTAGVLASMAGITAQEAEGILTEFTKLGLTEELELETENGLVTAYIINENGAVIPFLFAARLAAEPTAKVRITSIEKTDRKKDEVAPC